jgi:hypothetical protein
MKHPSGAIVGPTGKPLTVDDLPPPDIQRWVMRRKAEVILAVRGGLVSLDYVCQRYSLSKDEFESWERQLERYGLPGLRTTLLQTYRDSGSEPEGSDDLTASTTI